MQQTQPVHMHVSVIIEELIKAELDQSQAVIKSDPQVSYIQFVHAHCSLFQLFGLKA